MAIGLLCGVPRKHLVANLDEFTFRSIHINRRLRRHAGLLSLFKTAAHLNTSDPQDV
jgi:hypothetical protein